MWQKLLENVRKYGKSAKLWKGELEMLQKSEMETNLWDSSLWCFADKSGNSHGILRQEKD